MEATSPHILRHMPHCTKQGWTSTKKAEATCFKLSAVQKRKKEMDHTTVPQHSSTTAIPLSHSPGPQTAHSTSEMDVDERNWTRLGSFIAQQVPQYTAREVPMNKKDGSIVMACMAYMPNLIDIVMI